MNVFIGLFIILAFLVIGNLLSALLGGFIPGSVIGMLLLFLSLLTGVIKDKYLKAELWSCSHILCAFLESCLHVCFLL